MLNELGSLKGVLCIMDDILVLRKTLWKKEHDEGPEAVLTRLNRARITLKPDIFEFSRQLKFAGHSLSAQGIRPDSDNTAAF